MKQLRRYQSEGIEAIRKCFQDNRKRVLAVCPTGGGKTEIFSTIIKKAVENNQRVLLVVRRRMLIKQAFKRVLPYYSKVSAIMANFGRFNLDSKVQLCSIDTVHSRAKKGKLSFLKNYDLVIIDEAHDCVAKNYKQFFEFLEDEEYKNKSKYKKRYIGFTATPYKVAKKFHDFWDSCVNITNTRELIRLGFLSEYSMVEAVNIDTTGVKVNIKGDYDSKELFNRVHKKKIYGDIVSKYQNFAMNKTALLFAVSVEHSKAVAKEFNDNGIEAVHCDANSNEGYRQQCIARMEECAKLRKPFIICNVNILSTGVDIPCCEVAILARPTKSLNLYLQQIGRVLRTSKETGKKLALIIDHAGNAHEHGYPCDVRRPHLRKTDTSSRNIREESLAVKTCLHCHCLNPVFKKECMDCGNPFGKIDVELSQHAAEMQNISIEERIQNSYQSETRFARMHGKNTDHAHRILFKRYGREYLERQKQYKIPEPLIEEFKIDLLRDEAKILYV